MRSHLHGVQMPDTSCRNGQFSFNKH